MTQSQEIMIYLHKHGSITPMDALREFGCFRLGARIWDLRHEYGHSIETVPETKNGKTYARYFLRNKAAA